LILNDGMHPRVSRREIAAGRMPNTEYLIRNGFHAWDTVSVFPTSTPVAVSSIVTGAPPSLHGISGMYWYDRASGEPVYYGDNLHLIQQHFGPFFRNIVVNLNHRHLSRRVATIFERLEARGKVTASLNSLCFRGPTPHQTTLPVFLRMLPGVKFGADEIYGPTHMRWGDFARSGPAESRVFGEHGPFRQFGISDDCTMRAFLELAEAGELPDFVMLYFPDNDVWSHQHGPEAGGVHLRKFDEYLASLFDVLGGKEKAVAENNFFLVADHAQAAIGYSDESIIDLDQVLGEYHRLTFGQPWRNEEVFVCPNGRFAQIYVDPGRPEIRERLRLTLLADPRIEQVLWREGVQYHASAPGCGELVFERGLRYHDRLGNGWKLSGETGVLGAEATGLHVEFERFPDAFSRVQQALDNPAAGDVLLTAKDGYEFAGNGEETHLGGGSHGGLLAEESYVPFVACGPNVDRTMIAQLITDLPDLAMAAFGYRRRRLSLRRSA
jgi:hypothetical protein